MKRGAKSRGFLILVSEILYFLVKHFLTADVFGWKEAIRCGFLFVFFVAQSRAGLELFGTVVLENGTKLTLQLFLWQSPNPLAHELPAFEKKQVRNALHLVVGCR